MNTKTIGIIGCGFIGTTIANHIGKSLQDRVSEILLYDEDASRASLIKNAVSISRAVDSADDIFNHADLVIESAAPAAVRPVLEGCINGKKDILIISVGGVLGNEYYLDKAREAGINVLMPSGAIAGIDAIKAAKVAGIDKVTITTRKGPASLKGAPYLEEKGIDIDSITGETVIFEGSAREAIKTFPKNINVSVMLSLAGIGPEKTKVRIVVSPEYVRNTHEIEVEGPSGRILTRCENVPSPENPRTSYLAPLSCIAALAGYFDTINIGT